MKTICLGLAALAVGVLPASRQTPATIIASPTHTSGAKPVYPRLRGLPDASVMAMVNALLAGQEKTDRASQSECYAQIRQQKQKVDKDSFSEDVRVTYLTRRYLSVNVVSSYDCAGAYPTAGAEAPLTLDLTTGAALDWTAAFKPEFESALPRLYWKRLPKAGLDKDCRDMFVGSDATWPGADFWLVAGRGLAVQPQLPHAMAVCSVKVVLSPTDLRPYVKNARLLADLTADTPARRHTAGVRP